MSQNPDNEQRTVTSARRIKSRYKRCVGDVRNIRAFEQKRKNLASRVTRLTQGVVNQIAYAIERGHHAEIAVAGCGISKEAFANYMKRGRDDQQRLEALMERGIELRDEDYSICFDLYSKVQKALFEAQDTPLSVIQKAGEEGDWKAAAHFLERRFSKQWGRKLDQRVDTNAPATANVQTVIVVPKRAESIEEWNELTKQRKNGTITYERQEALPEKNKEVTINKDATLDEIIEG